MLIGRKNRPQRLVAQEKQPQRFVADSKRPQRFVAWEKLPQSEITFKGTLNTFSNLFIRSTCTVGVMKGNGEARLFLQDVLEWHLIFFERHLHFLSKQYLKAKCLLNELFIRLVIYR